MHHTDEIDLSNVLPGVDLALWLQLIIAAVVAIALGVLAVAVL